MEILFYKNSEYPSLATHPMKHIWLTPLYNSIITSSNICVNYGPRPFMSSEPCLTIQLMYNPTFLFLRLYMIPYCITWYIKYIWFFLFSMLLRNYDSRISCLSVCFYLNINSLLYLHCI